MRRSGNKNGYTQVDHVTFDLILPMLSGSAQLIFLRIYRQTVGWKKPSDKMATSHFRETCNIKWDQTVRTAIEELVELDLIIVTGERTQIKEFEIKWDTIALYHQEFMENSTDDN